MDLDRIGTVRGLHSLADQRTPGRAVEANLGGDSLIAVDRKGSHGHALKQTQRDWKQAECSTHRLDHWFEPRLARCRIPLRSTRQRYHFRFGIGYGWNVLFLKRLI